ncbi:MAG: flagellar basal body-associated protein FliL [Bacillota bacterium]
MAVVIFAGLGYFAASKVWGFPVFGTGGKVAKPPPAAPSAMVSLGQFMTNLSDNSRYIRVTVDLEIDSSRSQEVTDKTSELKTDVYALLRSKSFKELSGENGLRDLQAEIKKRFDEKLAGAVRNVFFSEFIIQ